MLCIYMICLLTKWYKLLFDILLYVFYLSLSNNFLYDKNVAMFYVRPICGKDYISLYYTAVVMHLYYCYKHCQQGKA